MKCTNGCKTVVKSHPKAKIQTEYEKPYEGKHWFKKICPKCGNKSKPVIS